MPNDSRRLMAIESSTPHGTMSNDSNRLIDTIQFISLKCQAKLPLVDAGTGKHYVSRILEHGVLGCCTNDVNFIYESLDNGTEFKNRDMLEFCGNKGIKQEYSNARTPQQNEVAERMNRTLIEAARTMLADSLLPTTFWAEAVSVTTAV
ncbi:putative ribonuclease H-like domain-containing protein [Tanacetum coccineum]